MLDPKQYKGGGLTLALLIGLFAVGVCWVTELTRPVHAFPVRLALCAAGGVAVGLVICLVSMPFLKRGV